MKLLTLFFKSQPYLSVISFTVAMIIGALSNHNPSLYPWYGVFLSTFVISVSMILFILSWKDNKPGYKSILFFSTFMLYIGISMLIGGIMYNKEIELNITQFRISIMFVPSIVITIIIVSIIFNKSKSILIWKDNYFEKE